MQKERYYMTMKFDASHGLLKEEIASYQDTVTKLHEVIRKRTGAGNDFMGWVEWPVSEHG